MNATATRNKPAANSPAMSSTAEFLEHATEEVEHADDLASLLDAGH